MEIWKEKKWLQKSNLKIAISLPFLVKNVAWGLFILLIANPILDTRISVRTLSFIMLRVPPLASKTGWTGELWLNHVLLILEKKGIAFFIANKSEINLFFFFSFFTFFFPQDFFSFIFFLLFFYHF